MIAFTRKEIQVTDAGGGRVSATLVGCQCGDLCPPAMPRLRRELLHARRPMPGERGIMSRKKPSPKPAAKAPEPVFGPLRVDFDPGNSKLGVGSYQVCRGQDPHGRAYQLVAELSGQAIYLIVAGMPTRVVYTRSLVEAMMFASASEPGPS
jgi:hypothetical protein